MRVLSTLVHDPLFDDLRDFVDDRPDEETFLVDSLNDLRLITGATESQLPASEQTDQCGWASLLEAPSVFDLCRYTEDGKYVLVFLAYSNDGGPLVIIPRAIAEQCPNVARSIEMTNEFWGV